MIEIIITNTKEGSICGDNKKGVFAVKGVAQVTQAAWSLPMHRLKAVLQTVAIGVKDKKRKIKGQVLTAFAFTDRFRAGPDVTYVTSLHIEFYEHGLFIT